MQESSLASVTHNLSEGSTFTVYTNIGMCRVPGGVTRGASMLGRDVRAVTVDSLEEMAPELARRS